MLRVLGVLRSNDGDLGRKASSGTVLPARGPLVSGCWCHEPNPTLRHRNPERGTLLPEQERLDSTQ
jgi:hypothetical protein